MKKIALILVFLVSLINSNSQDTFSICAVDTITGEVGSAGASCIGAPQIPQGCYILSDVIPGIGVVHTQAYYLAANQNYAHELMIMGLPPQQIVDSLVANDAQNNPHRRQYGIVDFNGFTGSARTAAYTGVNCDDYKNHIIGPNYTIQGNILLGQHILDSMEARFLSSEGELACRLMEALQGAKVVGADTRCLVDGVSSLSSFLRVAQPDDPANDIYLDLNVPSTPDGIDPIDSLQTLIDDWGGCITSNIGFRFQDNKIKVYPNPSNEILTFDFTNIKYNESGTLIIYNLTGTEVYTKNIINSESITIKTDFEPGIYYYRFSNGNIENYNGKIIFY